MKNKAFTITFKELREPKIRFVRVMLFHSAKEAWQKLREAIPYTFQIPVDVKLLKSPQ